MGEQGNTPSLLKHLCAPGAVFSFDVAARGTVSSGPAPAARAASLDVESLFALTEAPLPSSFEPGGEPYCLK